MKEFLYERFLQCLSEKRAISQVDMFPVTAELNPADYYILKEIEGDLEILGFSIRYSGKNKITINGRPADNSSSDPLEMLEILIEDFKKTQTSHRKQVQKNRLQQAWPVHQLSNMVKC
jgi:DNA mismatch repair ATPase MutL